MDVPKRIVDERLARHRAKERFRGEKARTMANEANEANENERGR